jgi:paraquat-inducible protein B
MEQLAKNLEKLPLEDMVNRIASAAAGLDRLLNAPELMQSVAALNSSLNDIQKLVTNVNGQISPVGSSVQDTLRDVQGLVRRVEGQVDPIGSSLQKTLEDTRKLVGNFNSRVDPLYVEILAVIRQAGGAIEQAEAALAQLGKGADGDSALMVGLVDSFSEFEKAARSVRALADYLEKNPEALLRGKGGLGGK